METRTKLIEEWMDYAVPQLWRDEEIAISVFNFMFRRFSQHFTSKQDLISWCEEQKKKERPKEEQFGTFVDGYYNLALDSVITKINE